MKQKTKNKNEFWNFIFTAEQAAKIKAQDGTEIFKFYIENFKRIEYLVDEYLSKKYSRQELYRTQIKQDYLDQIYVDLPNVNFTDNSYIIQSIRYMLPYVEDGGVSYLKENNTKKLSTTYNKLANVCPLHFQTEDGEEHIITDMLMICDEPHYEFLEENYDEMCSKILEFCSKILKSDKQREWLEYWMYGNYDVFIAQHMGMTQGNELKLKTRVRKALVESLSELQEFLYRESGLSLERYKNEILDLQEFFCRAKERKSAEQRKRQKSPEYRAKLREINAKRKEAKLEWQRKNREKQKALKNAIQ